MWHTHTDALAADDVSCNSSHHGLLTKGVASLRLTFSIKQWLRETGLEHQPGPRRKMGSAAVLTFRRGLRNSSKDLPTHASSIDTPTARQQQVIRASTPTSQVSASPPLLTHLLLLASHHPSSGSPLSPKMSPPFPRTLLALPTGQLTLPACKSTAAPYLSYSVLGGNLLSCMGE